MIHLIDQRRLPQEVSIIPSISLKDNIDHIRTLAVRGAPAIGSFAAFSLALSIKRGEGSKTSYEMLLGSRPTAVDLKNCLDEVMTGFMKGGADEAVETAFSIYDGIIESCRKIGGTGASIIPDDARIMTHCNAGALATIDWGTALAPIRVKARAGGKPFVWVSETRPLLQGSRLTAWELLQEGIDHRIHVDGASGHIMSGGDVDLVITGADRICANGDFANKIGTMEKAILAREFDIPFYVAFPRTTLDLKCPSGKSIEIEERSGDEVAYSWKERVAPVNSKAINPAFDVTPAELVTGYITEDSVFSLAGFLEMYIKKAPL